MFQTTNQNGYSPENDQIKQSSWYGVGPEPRTKYVYRVCVAHEHPWTTASLDAHQQGLDPPPKADLHSLNSSSRTLRLFKFSSSGQSFLKSGRAKVHQNPVPFSTKELTTFSSTFSLSKRWFLVHPIGNSIKKTGWPNGHPLSGISRIPKIGDVLYTIKIHKNHIKPY